MASSEVRDRIEQLGIIPIVRTETRELARQAAEALVLGGADVVEITTGVPDAPGLIQELCARYGASVTIGAGTVLSVEDARMCLEAGARFLVAPTFEAAVVRFALERDVAIVPGALTPREVAAAWAGGATLVKVFPCAAVGGPAYLEALAEVLPEVRLVPTGGVKLENLAAYLDAGARAFGVAGELLDRAALLAGQTQRISEKTATFLAALASARAARRNEHRDAANVPAE